MPDIENELRHYREHFRDKVVYCNCDDPYISAFFAYFARNFEFFGLKKLITTCYKSLAADRFSEEDSERSIKLEYLGGATNGLPTPDDIGVIPLEGDGDFRGDECVNILKEADIVVTNPPFSLFREYVVQLANYDKDFLIIGNKNAITYKEIFKMIKANELWVGSMPMGRDMLFDIPDEYARRMRETGKEGSNYKIVDGVIYGRSPSIWYTNIEHKKRHEEMILVQRYHGNEDAYPRYDNYDAIEVSRTQNIPLDYDGVMGVPITFLDKYNPDQFEIVGATESEGKGFSQGLWKPDSRIAQAMANGQKVYKRLFIRNRNPMLPEA